MPILSGPILAGGLNLLAVNPGLVIWTAITFLVVFLILWRFAWKPIIAALDARNEKIESDIAESRKLREDAEKLLKDYESKTDAAKAEAMSLLDEARKDAMKSRDKIIADAQTEAQNIMTKANAEIDQARLKALADLESSVVDLSLEVLNNVFQGKLKDGEHKAIIEGELAAIKANRN